MRLLRLEVHNYKSLRQVSFEPSALSCLVGPNASGKSNFAEALHFLSEVYSNGLEVAIGRKGGYENIAHRRQRRSKAAISFRIVSEAPWGRVKRSIFVDEGASLPGHHFRFDHRFDFSTVGTGIRANYRVDREELSVTQVAPDNSSSERFKLRRDKNSLVEFSTAGEGSPFEMELQWLRENLEKFEETGALRPQSLIARQPLFYTPLFQDFFSEIARMQVFRFSPDLSRSSGIPTPNPELAPAGENLPALVDWLQRSHPKRWEIVIDGMRDILPGLVDVSVRYLHTKALGLFFEEESAGKPWIADDVSDGTIQALAMLVASVDPRSSVLMVEEPENSVHPWIIRSIVGRFRDLSRSKTVILTSHSPPLIDQLRPSEIWVVSRSDGETSVRPLLEYDPAIEEQWEAGSFRLSDALDSALVPQAVPGGTE